MCIRDRGYGAEQAAIIDAREYHLLRAVAVYRKRLLAPMTHTETAPRGLTEDEIQARVVAAEGKVGFEFEKKSPAKKPATKKTKE